MYQTATRGPGEWAFARSADAAGRAGTTHTAAGHAAASPGQPDPPPVRFAARRMRPEQVFGLVFVVGLHLGLLYAMWNYRLLPAPDAVKTVFVNFISPPAKTEPPAKPLPPKPVKLDKPLPVTPKPTPPPPQQLVAETPVLAASEPVAPAPPAVPTPAPVIAAPTPVVAAPAPAAPAKPAGPVSLAEDLSVSCPDRAPPAYPLSARRRGEQGRVVLRVELDERGQIARAQVATSSGSSQLDEAALAAVRQWHCNPAQRGGQAVRAVALQPFNFTLEGR